MKKNITNIIAVNEVDWYTNNKDHFAELPLKTQWIIRKNIKALEAVSQEFLTFRTELDQKRATDWFVEGNGKCEKTTDENGDEILRILDEYMDEFVKYNDDLNKQIFDIASEEIEVEVQPINLEAIIEYVDEYNLDFNLDDLEMLTIFTEDEE